MLTTDTTYLHGWASVIVQDVLLPLRRREWTPRGQIRRLRAAIVAVAAFAFFFSLFFGQVDYILMFFAVTGALWMASGPVVTLGLYWKRGTTAGAFAAMAFGVSAALAAILAQKFWVSGLYPWIAAHGWALALDRALRALSSPFEPWVHWELTPDKFPVNSTEIGVLTQLATLAIYAAVSLATCRAPFDMDRMLHRGKWADPEEAAAERAPKPPAWERLLGIDARYTRGDKALAWSVFLYSFVLWFCVCFLGNVVWHAVSPQPPSWWGRYFFWTNLVVPCLVGAVSTVWFGVFSSRDLLRLFRDLEARDRSGAGPDVADDGRVETS
jgi:Na+/proline symporter